MSSFYIMTSIFERKLLNTVLSIYNANDISSNLVSLGYGTAKNEMLDYLGLEKSAKVVINSFITSETWKKICPILKTKLQIDIPGNGIAYIVPVSSVGGKPQLQFLYGKQEYIMEGESVLQNTTYELLIVVSNIGYSNEVMEAARKAKAGGGTVLHAKGTGSHTAETFLGVSLASEKEIIYIVVKKDIKNDVMQAIMTEAGLHSKAQSIVFSLPVTSTLGMKFAEFIEQEEAEE